MKKEKKALVAVTIGFETVLVEMTEEEKKKLGSIVNAFFGKKHFEGSI
jgi:hypothetical protein